MELKGVLHLWSETGTEGGYWAFQDERFIEPPTDDYPYAKWSYDGLHVLENGDELTIYHPETNKVVWQGQIDLQQHPLFTEYTTEGFWIHADQKNISREDWSKFFLREYPARLKKRTP